MHFCTALLLAAILSVPWPGAVILSLLGLGMVIYMLSVMWRMRRVPDDQPPFKDWLWYLDIPLAAYIVLILAAVALPTNPALVLYIIGAVMVSLLFTGIHNAWDLVTYLAIDRAHPEK